jgi:hypothetical protein
MWQVILLAIAALFGWASYHYFIADPGLAQAFAEADRLDPGWRLEQLLAARSAVLDAENGAGVVLEAHWLLPAGWLASPSLEDRIREIPLNAQLPKEQVQELRKALTVAEPALVPARKLADFPRGRYSMTWTPDYITTPFPHLRAPRDMAHLLSLDAGLRAQDEDADGALASSTAVLNAGRSLGDEPAAVSQLVRTSCQVLAVRSIERTLAQGTPSEAALKKLQELLEDEAAQPLLLMAARAERAGTHAAFQAIKSRQFNRRAMGLRSNHVVPDDMLSVIDSVIVRGKQVPHFRYLSEYVEIAKLPPRERLSRLEQVPQMQAELPGIVGDFTRGSNDRKMALVFLGRQALVRCAVVAVAAERYRRAKQRWPDKVTDLMPEYLGEIPEDPFDGAPVRLRNLKDGVIVSSSGPDGEEDAARRPDTPAEASNLHFRLWDVEGRRQPAPNLPVALPEPAAPAAPKR